MKELEDITGEEKVTYLRFQNGSTIMGIVEHETDEYVKLVGVMDISIVDAGMLMQPAIPYGIDQEIKILKTNILFIIEPNEILTQLYLERSAESLNILMDYLRKVEQKKKELVKRLN